MTHDRLEEQLAAELDRRADRAKLAHDWSRRVLLPAVMSGIANRPQPVVTTRWSAFAGLATVAVILVVLVVVLPRIVPGPASTGPAASTSPVAVTPPAVPSNLRVLSTGEFASALAAGQLSSSTVVVSGSVGPNLRYGPLCGPPVRCYIGPLVGTDPEVDVYGDWVRGAEGEGVQIDGGLYQWDWWTLPRRIEGENLLVHVAGGVVTLIGNLDVARSSVPLSVEEAAALDPNSQASDETFIVDGWLNDSEPPGTSLNIDCVPQPSGSQIAGLPSRYCKPADRLTNLPLGGLLGSVPDGWSSIQVQIGAADQFGRGELSAQGLFAISPRLYAGCLPGPSPCWQWDVVGRLSDTPPVVPATTPVAGREVVCGPPASEGVPSIIDQIGIVDSCQVIKPPFVDPSWTPLAVRNPTGNADALEVVWSGIPCDIETTFTLRRLTDGAHLDGVRPSNDGPCNEPLVWHQIRVALTEPLLAETITASISYPTATVTPTPTTLGIVDCSGDGPDVQITDYIGEVISCEIGRVPRGSVAGRQTVENAGPDLRTLDIVWLSSSCVTHADVMFQATTEAYRVAIAEFGPGGCEGSPAANELLILLTRDVRADLVQVRVRAAPQTSPSP